MDLKSIVLNKRMKFFLNFTLISSFLLVSWAYPCDVQDTAEPSHQSTCQYSKPHNLLPKSACPNTAYLVSGILAEEDGKNALSISLPENLCSKMVDIQHAYERGRCSQHLLISEHSHCCRFESANRGNELGRHLEEPNNDILSPKPNGNLNYLSNVNSCGSLTHNKSKKFIETKVAAMKLQGFNL